jgi:hypothetical protein
MPHKKSIPSTVLIALVFTIVFTVAITRPVEAQVRADPNTESNDSCITCHEDLYFLHDTGKWYCIRESPMTCTGCHGGNGSVISKEKAHANRAAHPIINEDVSKCQECHPEQCDERVDTFREEAGISHVLVSAPYLPDSQIHEAALLPAEFNTEQASNSLVNFWEVVPVILLTGAALAIYIFYRFRHRMK